MSTAAPPFFAVFPLFFLFAAALLVTRLVAFAAARSSTRSDTWALARGDEVFADASPGVDGTTTRPATAADRAATVAVAFTAPDLAPEATGMLLRRRVQGCDIAAAVVALVVGGHLRMAREHDGRGRPVGWRLTGLPLDPTRQAPMTPLQAAVRGALPGPGDSATLPEIKPHLAPVVRAERPRLERAVGGEPWFRRGGWGRGVVLSVVSSVLFVVAFLLAMSGTALTLAALLAPVAGVMLGTSGGPGHAPRRRTARGSAAVYRLQAFAEYLRTAEGHRLRQEEAAAVFSRYLPHAVALGVTREWAGAFAQAAAAADPQVSAAWGADLAWYSAVGADAGDLGALGADGFGDGFGDLGSFGADLSDLGSSLGDFASSMESFAGDLGSDLGGGFDGGSFDGGGFDGGGSDGGGGSDSGGGGGD